MKLIPATQFNVEAFDRWRLDFRSQDLTAPKYIFNTYSYSKFLQQSLKLGMFIPCDEKGNVLQEPKTTVYQDANFDIDEMEIWNKAKERVLFEIPYESIEDAEDGIMFNDRFFIVSKKSGHLIYNRNSAKTIENIANDNSISFYLTDSAIKQIGLDN